MAAGALGISSHGIGLDVVFQIILVLTPEHIQSDEMYKAIRLIELIGVVKIW